MFFTSLGISPTNSKNKKFFSIKSFLMQEKISFLSCCMYLSPLFKKHFFKFLLKKYIEQKFSLAWNIEGNGLISKCSENFSITITFWHRKLPLLQWVNKAPSITTFSPLFLPYNIIFKKNSYSLSRINAIDARFS